MVIRVSKPKTSLSVWRNGGKVEGESDGGNGDSDDSKGGDDNGGGDNGDDEER